VIEVPECRTDTFSLLEIDIHLANNERRRLHHHGQAAPLAFAQWSVALTREGLFGAAATASGGALPLVDTRPLFHAPAVDA
jgi:hypothetical protein